MASKQRNAEKARVSRALLDAATEGKLPKQSSAFKPGDEVAMIAQVGQPFQTFEIDGKQYPLTYTVTRLSEGDVPGGGVHVRVNAIVAGELTIDPRPTGRVCHYAARAAQLKLLKSATPAKPSA